MKSSRVFKKISLIHWEQASEWRCGRTLEEQTSLIEDVGSGESGENVNLGSKSRGL